MTPTEILDRQIRRGDVIDFWLSISLALNAGVAAIDMFVGARLGAIVSVMTAIAIAIVQLWLGILQRKLKLLRAMMKETWTMETVCPFCGAQHCGVAGVSGPEPAPSPGDVTMCIDCGEWAVFAEGDGPALRKPTDAEYDKIAAAAELRRLRKAWVMANEKSRPQ